jgi:LPS-assembly lipoprotein
MWSPDRARRGLTLAGAVLVLTACGFTFRGAPKFPPAMADTYIDAQDRYTPFYQELVAVLRQNDIRIVSDPKAARTSIRILADNTGRRLLSVTTSNVPAEYEVFYRVRFAVTVDGREAVAPEQLALTRAYSFDDTEVLGKSREEDNVRRSLASDLVGLVALRLAAVRE